MRKASSAVAATAVLALGTLTGCGLEEIVAYGCSDRDRGFAVELRQLPILAVHPDDARLVDETSGCDDDDGFAHAGRIYRSALTRTQVVAFYRTAAERDGWQWAGDPVPAPSAGLLVSAARSCLTREVDGTTAHLSVWFPSDFNGLEGEPDAPADEYGLEITASHDGDAWC